MNIISKSKPWLRLVYDSADIPACPDLRNRDSRQLSLPFPEPDVVVILDVAEFEFSSFKRAMSYLKPKWVFDIRAAPRLDRLAGGRIHAFREFERIGTQYIDIFGLLGISNYKNAASNPVFWTPVVEEFLRSSTSMNGPYMALLDDASLINTVSKSFASSISHVTGRDVSLSRLKSDADILEIS